MSDVLEVLDAEVIPKAQIHSWRRRARSLAEAGKWREAVAVQRAIVAAAPPGAAREQFRDRYRLLRWELLVGQWRDALESIDGLYLRLNRHGTKGEVAIGWLFLARSIAQFQLGFGSRFRRSLATVVRVARTRKSEPLLESALRLVFMGEMLKRGDGPATQRITRRLTILQKPRASVGLQPRVDRSSKPGLPHSLSTDSVAAFQLPEPVSSRGVPWLRLPELLTGPIRSGSEGALAGSMPPCFDRSEEEPEAPSSELREWLGRTEQDPILTTPAWLVPELAWEIERLASHLDAGLRTRLLLALWNMSTRLIEAYAKAEALMALAELSLWCIGEEHVDLPSGDQLVFKARSDLGMAAALLRELGFDVRVQECEERWSRLIRIGSRESRVAEATDLVSDRPGLHHGSPTTGLAMTSRSSSSSRSMISRESVRRRCRAAGFVTDDSRLLGEISRMMLLARSPLPALIHGESGTGKEVLARALHEWSGRTGEFVAIHCGAIPRDLLESELFGHARGAFTGAVGEKAGLFETANDGTLFLDEIGEMGEEAQMKVLRVLESGEVRRVGDVKTHKVRVRLVAATHRNLEEAVQEGRFRLDLLYRIRGIHTRISPIRERRGDIASLAHHVLDTARESGEALRFDPEAIARLLAYDWPGNVRELRATILRAAYLAMELGISRIDNMLLGLPPLAGSPDDQNEFLMPSILADEPESAELSTEEVAAAGLDKVLESLERRLIVQALDENGWNRTRTAERLGGLSRTTLLSKMKRLGIEAISC